jgi:RNA polymerase sigma-70 factor (ECF subfamily)
MSPRDRLRPAPTEPFAALIAAMALRGDRQAFAALFSHFAPRVKAYMMRLGAGAEAAEELAQETLLIVWRRAAAFNLTRAAPSTWIFTIARNLRIDLARREQRQGPRSDPSDVSEDPPIPDALLAGAEDGARIARALAALPQAQAQVVRLAYFSDKPHAQIARELDVPLGTVKSRLRLAMGHMRGALGGDA